MLIVIDYNDSIYYWFSYWIFEEREREREKVCGENFRKVELCYTIVCGHCHEKPGLDAISDIDLSDVSDDVFIEEAEYDKIYFIDYLISITTYQVSDVN